MPTVDDVLGWIRPPLEEMKQEYAADPGKPWEERREFFLRQLGLHDASQDPVVRELLEHLDQTPEDERNKLLGSDELDSMVYELARQHSAVQETVHAEGGHETAHQEPAAYDEQAWQAFLTQNGPQWDGTEASWDQFRQWFEYYAAEQNLGVPAAALLDYLAAHPAAERIAAFAQYGVTIQTPPPQEATSGDRAAEQGGQESAVATAEEEASEAITGDALKANPEYLDMTEDQRMSRMSEVLADLEAAG